MFIISLENSGIKKVTTADGLKLFFVKKIKSNK